MASICRFDSGTTATQILNLNDTSSTTNYCWPTWVNCVEAPVDPKLLRRQELKAASLARVRELCAMPAPRPVNHRIPGRDIRRLIPRRV
jgi:hypothetical protein